MTGLDVAAAVDAMAGLLADRRIPHAFGGALAQNYWGVVRATQDVDVLALIPALGLQEFADAMTAHGFVARDAEGREQPITVPGIVQSQREAGLFAVWLGMVKVEVFTPRIPLQDRILERARTMPWRNRMIPVTTAEDLILLKMVFHREKDLRDIRAMVATSGAQLDRGYMLGQARQVLASQAIEELKQLLSLA